jgi:hypothetical protein
MAPGSRGHEAIWAVCQRFLEDFHEKSCFLQNHFCVLGDDLESPGVAFGEILARFGAISVRSGPHFGAGPS